jgi:protein arginine N-methyltransferase 2
MQTVRSVVSMVECRKQPARNFSLGFRVHIIVHPTALFEPYRIVTFTFSLTRAPGKRSSMSASTDETSTAVAAGQALLAAAKTAPLATVRQLLKDGAPAWYQDEALGWSCLHYAAERRDPKLLEVLLRGGAVWNAVDEWGRTAGEVCLSLGWEEGWEIIRNEGVRTGMSFGRAIMPFMRSWLPE